MPSPNVFIEQPALRHPQFGEEERMHVDFVPKELLPAGRLGMTSCPGRSGDLESDLASLRAEHGTDLLVSLTEASDLQHIGVKDPARGCARLGLERAAFPILDGGVPVNTADFCWVIARVIGALRRQRAVVVHCRAGYGRTGLFVACCLIALGHDPETAIEAVRKARPGTIETAGQLAFVRGFRTLWNEGNRRRGA